MLSAHWLDYIILAIIGLSVLTGLFRGFIKELIALSVWVLAIWLAFRQSQWVATWLQPYIHDNTVRLIAAFIVILLVVLIAGSLVNALLSFILHRTGLSGTDRILGMGFGLVRGIFIVALLILAAKITVMPYEKYAKASYLLARFEPIVNWLYGYTPAFIKQMKIIDKPEQMPKH